MSQGFPRWAAEEISSASWTLVDTWERSGYILEVDRDNQRIDVQFYERLPEGRYIATLDAPNGRDVSKLQTGDAYVFQFKVYRATLSDRLTNLLKDEYDVTLDTIYKFELVKTEPLV